MMANEMELIINGVNIKLPEIPGEMLAELLRDRLKLTGTKIGCSELECGACTVLVDGQAILSCTYPAIRANGKRVLTIEGLSKLTDLHELHPLQEAFINFGAVQCGFCTPGQIMAAYGLLCKTSNPSLQDIRNALKDNLCRCGGYLAIEKAILAAAQALNNGTKVVECERKRSLVISIHALKPNRRLLVRLSIQMTRNLMECYMDTLNVPEFHMVELLILTLIRA
jgi:aerobic-type carbon monoxide dehydrogenase small subunit (CoxS/CutS family)